MIVAGQSSSMTKHRHMVMKVSSFSVTATFQKTAPVYTTDRNKGNPTDLLAEVAFGQYATDNYMAKIAEIHKLFTVVITVTKYSSRCFQNVNSKKPFLKRVSKADSQITHFDVVVSNHPIPNLHLLPRFPQCKSIVPQRQQSTLQSSTISLRLQSEFTAYAPGILAQIGKSKLFGAFDTTVKVRAFLLAAGCNNQASKFAG